MNRLGILAPSTQVYFDYSLALLSGLGKNPRAGQIKVYVFTLFLLGFWAFGLSQSERLTLGELRPRACPRLLMLNEIEGQTAFCQSFTVPENWLEPGEPRLELAILTLKARNLAKPDPIIFLQGGPGGAALSTIEFWQDLSWRDSRDIILFDQRGTGYGNPNLKCPELYRNPDFKEASARCRERLSQQGYDVDSFNSAQNASDIQAFINASQFQEVNLYGVSYGTRLALTLMRDHPEAIRAVVLDSTYPPQVERLSDFGANFSRALEQVFSTCSTDQACQKAYPDLKANFFTALASFGTLPYRQAFTGLELADEDILTLLFQAMYDEAIISALPYAFNKLYERDLTSFILLLSGLVSAEEVDKGKINVLKLGRSLADIFTFIWREVQSEAVYFATECPEDVFFQHYRKVKRNNEQLEPSLATMANLSALQMFAACRAWQAPRGQDIESQAVFSAIPSLILAGSFDPITPPEWGKRAAESLSQHYFFEFPTAAHGVFALGACPVGMVEAFFNLPEQMPDASCMQELELSFYVPQ